MVIMDYACSAMSRADCIIGGRSTTRKTKYPCLMGISMAITECASNRHANHVIRVNHRYGLQHIYTYSSLDFTAPSNTWQVVYPAFLHMTRTCVVAYRLVHNRFSSSYFYVRVVTNCNSYWYCYVVAPSCITNLLWRRTGCILDNILEVLVNFKISPM